jgi:Tfp pilus assembly protein PilN
VSTATTTRRADVALPRVNLLPPEIKEEQRLRRVKVAMAAVVAVAIAAVVLLDVQGGHSVSDAKAQLAAAAEQNAQINRELASYSDVKATAAQLAANKALLDQSMSTEVQWSGYLADFSVVLPSTTWLTSLTFSSQLAPGSLASPSQASGNIGTITVQGVAMKYENLADWLDSLNPENGLSGIYFSNASEQYIGSTKTVTFQASADLTAAALCEKAGGC